jgi:type IV pilus assembly protein PilC
MIFTPGQLNRRAELYHQLGSMITAGVPLIQALQMAANNSSLRASQKTISALIGHLQNGLTFSDSLTRAQGWMPEFDIALLSAGEHIGRLDTSFKQLANAYAMRASIIREALLDISWTLLTLHVMLLLFPLSYLIGLVLGIVNHNYLQCIPFFAEKIIVFGGGYSLVFLLIFLCQGKRGEFWRAMLEAVIRIVPMLRTAQQYLVLSRFSTALEALVSSGVSIIRGLPMAAAASGSPYLKRQVATWTADLESGQTPAELVSRTRYFPDMFRNMYHTGEISGKLDESLNRLQTYYRDEGFRILRMFLKIFNRIVYFIIVLIVGYIFITFWLNYFRTLFGQFD